MNKHGRPEDVSLLKEEASAEISQRKAYSDRLVEKWHRVDIGSGLDDMYTKDPERARRTAWGIEMQEKHLTSLSETVISQDFQTTPENVLKIVRIGTANSNRGNIFTEYPLSTVDDAIYYLQFTREQALRGATAGEKIYDQPRRYYAGETQRSATIGTGNGVLLTFTQAAALAVTPVVPLTVRVYVDGVLVGSDDGSGTLVGPTLDTGGTNTVDYTTGDVTVTFSAGNAPATGLIVDAQFNFDSEVEANYDQYGTVGISIEKRRFNARPQPLGYNFTRMTELTLGTHNFGDAETLLLTTVGDEHARRKDFRAVSFAKSIARTNPTTTFDANFADAGEVSDKSHAQRILSTMRNISGDVFNAVQRGELNRAIAGSRAVTYLQKHDLWREDDSQPRVGGTFLAGRLGQYEVYQCVANESEGLVAENEIILTYKDAQEPGDVAIAFGVLTELADRLAYPQHRVEGYLSTVEDKIDFVRRFLRRLVIENITT
jgi:hypothetical protein